MVVLRVVGIFLLVTLLSGCVAYLGNSVGRKVGRKKMSVFGMRPKHTSTFITIVTGAGIGFFTLALAAIFSESVRGLLSGTKQLEERQAFLQKEVDKLGTIVSQGRIVWGVGQPILQSTLNPALGEADLRAQIQQALKEANFLSIVTNNQIAAKQGETPVSVDAQLVTVDQARLDEFVHSLSTQEKVVGLRVLAAKNCLFQDTVPVKLEGLEAKLVFHEGEEVASRPVRPNNTRVILDWYAFLEQMKVNALKRDMMEINGGMGELDGADVIRIVDEIGHLKGPGRLVAVAKHDLYQTSSLAVKIEVRPDVHGTPQH